MYGEERRTVAYSNHVAPGRARYNKKDCFAAIAMTEAELIEKLRISFRLGQPRYARDDNVAAFFARVLAFKRIN